MTVAAGSATELVTCTAASGNYTQIGQSWAGDLGYVHAASALGTGVSFYGLQDSGGALSDAPTLTTFGTYQWNLTSAGLLSFAQVAAVPEADPLSMMFVGVGVMGFVARRRSKA